jgi:hypothetical protein
MRVIVTGGRNYKDRTRVYAELDAVDVTALSVGNCPSGADLYAREWANLRHRAYMTTVFHAYWSSQGPSAGPKRNSRMVAAGADLVLAFPGGKGTADCVAQARKAGIRVKEIV